MNIKNLAEKIGGEDTRDCPGIPCRGRQYSADDAIYKCLCRTSRAILDSKSGGGDTPDDVVAKNVYGEWSAQGERETRRKLIYESADIDILRDSIKERFTQLGKVVDKIIRDIGRGASPNYSVGILPEYNIPHTPCEAKKILSDIAQFLIDLQQPEDLTGARKAPISRGDDQETFSNVWPEPNSALAVWIEYDIIESKKNAKAEASFAELSYRVYQDMNRICSG